MSAADDFGNAVVSDSLLRDVAAEVAAAGRKHPSSPSRAAQEAVTASVKLVDGRLARQLPRTLGAAGALDAFNLAIREANDGLVAVSSTRLPGATVEELLPRADHAAPVMLADPFTTSGQRPSATTTPSTASPS